MTASPSITPRLAPDLSDAPQMLALLTRQRDGYLELISLGEKQSQLIANGQPDPLLTLLSQRQTLIDELAQLGEQIAAFHQQWDAVSAALGKQASQQVRELVAEVEGLLARIIEQDDKDRVQLETAQHGIRKELNKTAAAPQALNAYKAAASGTPRFTDRQG